MAGESFANFKVFLDLQRRHEGNHTGQTNRIPLFVNSISVNTNKSVMNIPIPFSGAIRGESTTLAMDIGMAQKTISIEGLLLGQTIVKNTGDGVKSRSMTSFELAQLIHSYVDASVFQDDQNMNRLIILIPSSVDKDFNYHNADAETQDVQDLPTIPLSWKNRSYDNAFTSLTGDTEAYFSPANSTEAGLVGIDGFIRTFSTQLSGTEFPAVTFNLEFEEAVVLADNFLDG